MKIEVSRLNQLQKNYEICCRKMDECAESGDIESFNKWLNYSNEINKALDLECKVCEGDINYE